MAGISILIGVESIDFVYLRKQTTATAGNLSAQIDKLQKARYIDVEKGFRGKTHRTGCRSTDIGIAAFEAYVTALQSYINRQKLDN